MKGGLGQSTVGTSSRDYMWYTIAKNVGALVFTFQESSNNSVSLRISILTKENSD